MHAHGGMTSRTCCSSLYSFPEFNWSQTLATWGNITIKTRAAVLSEAPARNSYLFSEHAAGCGQTVPRNACVDIRIKHQLFLFNLNKNVNMSTNISGTP
jgi:hypothetical protein